MDSFSDTISTILNERTAIHFIPGTDNADFGSLDLEKNPQKTQESFVWLLPNKTEATVTLVRKVIYSVIGDRTSPYFNLPEPTIVCTVNSFHHSPM